MITFVIDLNLYLPVMGNIEENICHRLGVIRTIMENHSPGTNGLVNNFQGLVQEIQTLRETHFGVSAQLTAYKALQPRAKCSLLPFVGQAFSFLFRTVSDGDLRAIRRNLHVLRRNQEGLTHIVEESLSVMNVSRMHISENRQTLNFVVSDMGTISDQVANVMQMFDNQTL